MGAGKWKPEFSETLRGKRVVICLDKDQPGQIHRRQIAVALEGIVSKVLWLVLPERKDLSAWAKTGRTTPEFHHLLKETGTFLLKIAGKQLQPDKAQRII
jgi:hypothetical protein